MHPINVTGNREAAVLDPICIIELLANKALNFSTEVEDSLLGGSR